MARGGYRPNSGPPSDPASARSAKRGIVAKTIPRRVFRRKFPDYPLPESPVQVATSAGVFTDDASTASFRAREIEIWNNAWRTYPAAHVWIDEPWRWHTVAHWARLSARCERIDVPATLIAQMIRLADEAMITTRGMREAGFVLAEPDAAPPTKSATKAPAARPPARKRKLALVTDDKAS